MTEVRQNTSGKSNLSRITGIEYVSDTKQIIFIIDNGKRFILTDGDIVTIPGTNIENIKADINKKPLTLSLIISPPFIRKNTDYIMLHGNGWTINEIQKDFLDKLQNPFNKWEKIINEKFVKWILEKINLEQNTSSRNNQTGQLNRAEQNKTSNQSSSIIKNANRKNNSFLIKDIEYDRTQITFILDNNKRYTIKETDKITIPALKKTDSPVHITIKENQLSLYIYPPMMISITGEGSNRDKIKKDFLHKLRNIPNKNQELVYTEFVKWISENSKLVIKTNTSVHYVCWSPDGTKLASASYSKMVRVWDSHTGSQLAQLQGHTERVSCVSWSPDGTKLASASMDKTVRVWDAHTGSQLAILQGNSRGMSSVDWSPDGTRLSSASYDKTVCIWDAHTGSQLAELQGHSDYVESVNWSPDGTKFASASDDKTVRVWNSVLDT